ncbi:MAG: glucose-6-phosphate dehydrogenase, partial [Thermoleophilaceae bacterium]
MAVTTAQQEPNPLTEGLERLPVHPTTLVIFGATGDLAHRKLLPAIYNLAHEGALPERFNLIGLSRGDIGDDGFREQARESIQQFSRRKPDDKVLSSLVDRMRYVSASFDDPNGYDELCKLMDAFDDDAGIAFNRLFYLSTAPAF